MSIAIHAIQPVRYNARDTDYQATAISALGPNSSNGSKGGNGSSGRQEIGNVTERRSCRRTPTDLVTRAGVEYGVTLRTYHKCRFHIAEPQKESYAPHSVP